MASMLVLLSLVVSSVVVESGASSSLGQAEREAEAHYLKALHCFEQNAPDYRLQGLRDLEEAVRLAPTNMTYRLALANLHFLGGSYHAARQGFERVAVDDSAAAYLSLGLLWRYDWLKSNDRRSLDRAVDALMSAAWLDPSKTDAWLLLVPLYLEQHKLEEAASAAFSALEFDPKRLEAHLAVAATLCHLGVVGVGDSIFRATIPRLPPALRADFERAAPLPPDPTLTKAAASGTGGASLSGRAEAEASAGALEPADEDRLWSWSRLTEQYVLLPADQRAHSRSAWASQPREEGHRFEWSRRGSGDGQTQGALWVSDELGIRMEILGRLLACRADLSESRTGDGAAPPSVALAAMYARILAALGGARPEGGSPAAGARVDPKK